MDMQPTTLVRTCGACPEQYDVKSADGSQVGYIRLRHGYFRVDAEPQGLTIFSRSFPLSGVEDIEPEEAGLEEHSSDGIFESADVRSAYLGIALRKIAEYHGEEPVTLDDVEMTHPSYF